MLLPYNIQPENSIYYNGAFLLKTLKEEKKLSLLDLFQKVKSNPKMTFAIFILCLDWLYLVNLAVINSNGEVELCL